MGFSIVKGIVMGAMAITSLAEPPIKSGILEGLPSSRCEREIEEALVAQGTIGAWVKQALNVEEPVFRSPTLVFGRWVEIEFKVDQVPVLYTAQNDRSLKIKFDEKCHPTVEQMPGMDFSKNSASHSMSDAELETYLAKNGTGIIYVWSPRMTYSAAYFKRFAGIARRLKLPFLPLVDPRATDAYTAKVSRAEGLPVGQSRLNAVELYMRNVTAHLPTTVLFKNGQILDTVVVGVMEEKDLESRVRGLLDLPAGEK